MHKKKNILIYFWYINIGKLLLKLRSLYLIRIEPKGWKVNIPLLIIFKTWVLEYIFKRKFQKKKKCALNYKIITLYINLFIY